MLALNTSMEFINDTSVSKAGFSLFLLKPAQRSRLASVEKNTGSNACKSSVACISLKTLPDY